MTSLNPSMAVSSSLFSSQLYLEHLEASALNAPVLGEEAREIQDLASQALRGKLDTSVVTDRVWRRLAIRFGRSIPGCEVVEGETVEFRVVSSEFVVFDPVDIPYILTWIDREFGGGLNLIEQNGDDLTLRFPPLTSFESGARRVFGNDAANLYYVPGEITKPEANEGHARRKQHVALPLEPQFFEQVGHVVPEFVYAIHDLNHAMDVAGIHPELLKIAVTLSSTLSALPEEVQATAYVQEQLHDLSELLRVRELTLGTFLKRAFLPWEHEVRSLYHQIIPSHERERRADLGRRYVDLVFDRWLPLLSEDRRPGVGRYRDVLHSFAQSHLRHP